MADPFDYDKYLGEVRARREQAKPPPAAPQVQRNTSALGDFGTALVVGAQRFVGDTVPGLLDIPVAAVTGRPLVSEGLAAIGRGTGFQPGKWAEHNQQLYSDKQQQFQRDADRTDGFLPTVQHYVNNPLRSAVKATESIPGMLGGAAAARTLMGTLPGAVALGAGEGAVMAGDAMHNMLADGVDARRAAMFATGVGVGGGALGVLGARVAGRIGGAVDPDAWLAGVAGRAAAGAPGRASRATGGMAGLAKRVTGGAVVEGLLEEMPQSALETVLGNVAADRDWDDNLGRSMGAGLVLGGMLGGAMNIPGAPRQVDMTQPSGSATPAPSGSATPAPSGSATPAPSGSATPAQPRTMADMRSEYTALDALVRDTRQAGTQAHADALTRMAEIRREAQSAGYPEAALTPQLAERRVAVLNKELARLEKQLDKALSDNPDGAQSVVEKIAARMRELEALNGELSSMTPQGAPVTQDNSAAPVAQAAPAAVPGAAAPVDATAAVPPAEAATDLTATPTGQLDMFGDGGAQAQAQAQALPEPVPVSELREDYQALSRRLATLTELADNGSAAAQAVADATMARMEEITAELKQRGVPAAQVSLPNALTALQVLDAREAELVAQRKANPSSAQQVRNELRRLQRERARLTREFNPDPAQGALFDPRGEPLAPVDPIIDTLRYAEGGPPRGVFTKTGAMTPEAAAFVEQWRDAPTADLRATSADLAGARAKTWRAEVLDAILGTRPDATAAATELERVERQRRVAASPAQATGAVTLSERQRQVFDYMQLAFNESRESDIIRADGTLQYNQIGKALGLARGSVKAAVDGVMANIAKAAGVTVDEFKKALRARDLAQRSAPDAAARGKVESSDYARLGMSPSEQRAEIDLAELFGDGDAGRQGSGMAIVESAGQTGEIGSESLGGTAEGDTILRDAGVLERGGIVTDPAADEDLELAQRAAERNAARDAWMDQVLAQPYAEIAAEDWDDMKSPDAPTAAELPKESAYEWMLYYAQWKDGEISNDEFERAQRDIEWDAINATRDGGNATAHAAVAGGYFSGRVIEESRAGTEAAGVAEQDAGSVRALGAPSGGVGTQGGARYSDAPQQGAVAPTTPARIRSVLRPLFFSNTRFENKVVVVASEADLDGLPGARSERLAGVQGFVRGGKVYLVAGNIDQGAELAVFLHEVGVHLGMPRLLGAQNFTRLSEQVQNWATSRGDAMEVQIAKRAVARVMHAEDRAAAREDVFDEDSFNHELIAYFVEEAVLAGVDPTAAQATSVLGRWFRRLWASVKVALRKFGIDRVDQLTAGDVVNLAYGAARLELNGAFHGTAADFRRFDHRFMGTGEGQQAFGWGTYLAQNHDVAHGYWLNDVDRKSATPGGGPEGNIHIVDTNIPESARLVWEAPLESQSDTVREGVLRVVREAGWHMRESQLGAMTGEDIYKKLSARLGSPKAASQRLDAAGVQAIEFFDATSRPRPLREIKDALLAALDQDAGFGEVDELVREGHFSPDQTRFLSALSRDDWLGFDYPAQAISAALGRDLSGFDPSPELLSAVEVLNRPRGDTRNLVVFNDKNIVRVASQRGGPDGQMRFSDRAPSSAAAAPTRVKMPGTLAAQFQARLQDPLFKGKELMLGFMTTSQLVDVYAGNRGMPALQEYDRVTRAMTTTTRKWIAEASALADRFAGLGAKGGRLIDATSAVMFDATMVGYDPDTADPAENNPQQAQLKARYDALPDAAKEVYRAVRDHFANTMKERTAITLGFLDKAFSARIAAADAAYEAAKSENDTRGMTQALRRLNSARASRDRELAGYKKQLSRIKGPYFPLMRYGDHIVIATSPQYAALEAEIQQRRADGLSTSSHDKQLAALRKSEEHYRVEAYERPSRADARAAELQSEGFAVRSMLAPAFHREAAAINAAGLEEVQDYVAEHFGPKVAGSINDMMSELYFRSLPEHHALQRQIRREGIAGASQDMLRAFSTAAQREAHYISRLKHSDDLRSALFKVRQQGKAGGRDTGLLAREVEARAVSDMQFSDTPVFDAIANVSYLANLALSPAFYMMNVMQVPMITMPWMKARFPESRVMPQLYRAYADSAKLIVSSYKEQGWRAELDIEKLQDDGERQMLEELLQRNLLDITMEHDLGAYANPRVSKKVTDVLRGVNLPTHITEIANRSVTALAAYRLARGKGLDQARAVDMAARAVSETQLDYSAGNTPRLMRQVFGSRGLAKLVFQFRKYQQGMAFLVVNSIHDAVKGDAAAKAVARRQLRWLFGTHAVMAGTLGVPLSGVVASGAALIASVFGDGDDDESFDPNVAWRNLLSDAFGPEIGLLLAKGLPAYAGVDVSARMGLGNVLHPFPFMQTRAGEDGQATLGRMMVAAGGAPMTLLTNMMDAADFMQQGQTIKAWERLTPIKGARDLFRAARLSDEGVTTRTGELALPADRFDGWDLAIRAAGFSPTLESEHYEAKTAVETAKREVTSRRNALLRQYALARMAGESTADIDADIRAFNARNPTRGLRIDASSKLRAVQARRTRTRDLNVQGVRVDRTARPFESRGRFAVVE